MSPLSRSYITILEDNLERKAEMKRYLGEFFSTRSAIFFDNAPDAIAWLKECLQFCALISLDRDLGSSYWRDGEIFDPGTGRDVVDYLVAAKVQCPVIIHSSNYAEAGGMEVALGFSDRLYKRVFPSRDLDWIGTDWVNTIKIFLQPIANADLTELLIPAVDAAWENFWEFALTYNVINDWDNLEKAIFFGKQSKQYYGNNNILPSSLSELRTCLWAERNYWQRYGVEPDENGTIYIRAILERIREKVRSGETESRKNNSNKIKNTNLADKIRGVIYGQAVGDALGLGAEGLLKSQVSIYYPDGLQNYSQIVRDRHRSCWVYGDWTDDTDMMLCILDSLLAQQRLNLWDIGIRFYQWASAGNPGLGYSTHCVLFSRYLSAIDFFQPDFENNYYVAAQHFWESYGKEAAANGGVMRTSILGVWEYLFPEKVRENASKVCQITHYDPRCVASCVAVSLTISVLLRGVTNIENLVAEIAAEVAQYHSEIWEYFERSKATSIEALQLGDERSMGYTLKTMSAGFWALQNAPSYADGVLQIIHEGGDADTNAAVAGAMLGAKFGYESIPKLWIEELAYKAELEVRVEQLIELVMSNE